MKFPVAVGTAILATAAVIAENAGNSTHLPHVDYSYCHQIMWSANNNNTMEHVFWSASSNNNNS